MDKIISVNNKYKKKAIKVYILLLIILTIVLILLKWSFFTIKNIEIVGIEHYTKEDICNILNIDEETNIFGFALENMFSDVEKDPYINNMNIQVTLPDTIKIVVEERKIIGYVPYMGTYLCIDKTGRVIDSSLYIVDSYPSFDGLMFSDFTIGNKLNVDNEETFLSMLEISNVLKKYELLEKIVKIDFTNNKDIIMYTRFVEVRMGTIDEYDKKINVLTSILDKLKENERGILDISDVSKKAIFKKII